jgi:spore photoproduct lyase
MNISKLYIDRQVVDLRETQAVRSRLDCPSEIVTDEQSIVDTIQRHRDGIQAGKEVLLLTRNRGAFVKSCPGTRNYTCCGYHILHIGTYCSMDCAYCILQTYFHPPILRYFTNHQDMLDQLSGLFRKRQICRIGTGEFTDSMIWERITLLSELLVPTFAAQNHAVLELKTKTTRIENLKELDHRRKTIVAWSLNSERIIREEERGTASLQARLQAAAKCAAWGYPLAFHFDPLVIYENCENEYASVIDQLFARVPADKIVWISLGALRFTPAMKKVMQQRFPQSKMVYGEFIPGLDGKLRYFKPLRIKLLHHLAAAIQKKAPKVCLYLCMEDDEVWQQALGFKPADKGGLPEMLDVRAAEMCGVYGEKG